MFIDAVDLHSSAILLDVDGTLLDFAPTPLDVEVPPDLTGALGRLREELGGALAFVSGRTLTELDLFFAPLKLAAIGGHGAELRLNDGTIVRAKNHLDPALRARLAAVAQDKQGLIVEDKGYSIALHYRMVPHLGPIVREQVNAVCAAFPTSSIEILPGKSVIEVKQPSFNKGSAVRELMHHAPFEGRKPIFIGDDVTDEAAFAVLPDFGGTGFSVGRELQGLAGVFDKPEDVRRWLIEMTHIRAEAS